MGQVPVSLPDVQGQPGETKTIAVQVGELTGHNVLAFQFALLYDDSILKITGFDTNDSLLEDFDGVIDNSNQGEYILGGYGISALTGQGDFIFLELEFLDYGETALTWDESQFGFNEGVPRADYTNGQVSISSETSAEDSPQMEDTDRENEQPDGFQLHNNYPNPFNPATNISYEISEPAMVTLQVYDVVGNKVEQLVQSNQSRGHYNVIWDASGLSSGIYLYELTAVKSSGDTYRRIRKMSLVK